jgi:DNA-binding transcriptional LysR family regulator
MYPAARTYPGDLLDHLRAYSALCECVERGERGAFTRAAGELALDVSVLRRRMQTLAHFVGAPLVDGRGPHLRLTPAGTRARTHALRTLEAAAELALIGADDGGPLRVACTGTILAEILPPALRAVRDVYPRLGFRVRRAGSEASRALVANDQVDFAVVRAEERPTGVAATRLAADRLWLATPRGSALAKATRLTMAAVAREPLVGYSTQSSTMRRIMAVLGPHGAAPWIEVDGKTAALSYVAAGLGIAFVSVVASQRPARAGVVLRDVTASFGPVAFWLIWAGGPRAASLSSSFRRPSADVGGVGGRQRWPSGVKEVTRDLRRRHRPQ